MAKDPSQIKATTSTEAVVPRTEKNDARSISLTSDLKLSAVPELAALDVYEAQTKSDGTIKGLKPLTKYHLVEVVDGAQIEPINAAEVSEGKVRKGIVFTKIIDTAKD